MNIMNNSGKDSVVTLGGREFKRVKNGLDEAEITSFINELIKERNELAQSQNHIASLTKLAETTIVEADRLAKQIKAEATEQAKAESAAIVDEVREQAQQMAEKEKAEILKMANEKAHAIKSQAEKQSRLLLESKKDKIREELRNFANQQFGYLLEKLESLKQQAAAMQADFDNKLSHAEEEKMPETAETAGEKSAETAAAADDGNATATKENKVLDELLKPIEDVRQTEKSFDLASILQGEDRTELGEPQWEIEILPPVDITKIMEVMTHLDQLHQVVNTEMIVPQIDSPSILVFLREEMDLIDMLRTIPAVAYAEEVPDGSDAANGKTRKARIGLSENTAPREEK